MRVLLRRTWFGPDGVRYRRTPGGVEVPDEFRKALPSTAVEVKKGVPQEKDLGGEPSTLSQLGSVINPPGSPDEAVVNYHEWPLAELRSEAQRRGIEGRSQMSKDDLVKALT